MTPPLKDFLGVSFILLEFWDPIVGMLGVPLFSLFLRTRIFSKSAYFWGFPHLKKQNFRAPTARFPLVNAQNFLRAFSAVYCHEVAYCVGEPKIFLCVRPSVRSYVRTFVRPFVRSAKTQIWERKRSKRGSRRDIWFQIWDPSRSRVIVEFWRFVRFTAWRPCPAGQF